MKKESILLFLTILTILICTSCAVMSSSNENDKPEYYQIAVDKTITKDLKVLDKDLEGKEIIFTAEFHGMKSNMELELKFFKYLKEKTNFKYYLCELSYAQGLMLNKFLETGDTDILDKLFIHYKGTYAYTKDSYNRWLQLYEYNKKLSAEDKIKIIGVDVEHQYEYAIRVIKELLPNDAPPADIKENIYILKLNKVNNKIIKTIHDDMLAKEDIYRSYLGEKYFDVEMILRNIKNLFFVKENLDLFNARRDTVMYENFIDIYNTIEKGIFYGQWGHNHTYQAEEGGIKWFATYLEEDKFKDKILTIAYTYNNCEFMNLDGKGGYTVKSFDTFSGYDLPNADEKTAVLFNIQDSSSLFHDSAKYFQYILVISDSKATEPFVK